MKDTCYVTKRKTKLHVEVPYATDFLETFKRLVPADART